MLTIKLASDIRKLSLHGSLQDSITNLFADADSVRDESIVIHGVVGRSLVTLMRCHLRKYSSAVEPYSELEEYYVPCIIQGAHIASESSKVIRSAFLSLTNMQAWVPPKPLTIRYQRLAKNSYKIGLSEISRHEPETYNTQFGTIEILKGVSHKGDQHHIDIRSESLVILKFSKAVSVGEVISYCGTLRSLASISSTASCIFDKLELTVTLRSESKVYLDLNWTDNPSNRSRGLHEIMSYTDLGGIEIIAKCLDEPRDSYQKILAMLAGFWTLDAPYNESRFIQMTVALEYLSKALGTTHIKRSRIRIEDHFHNVIDKIADELTALIPDLDWLGKMIARYRNWAAHADHPAPPKDLLFHLMVFLYLCIFIRFVHELGADTGKLCNKLYARHNLFAQCSARLRELQNQYPS